MRVRLRIGLSPFFPPFRTLFLKRDGSTNQLALPAGSHSVLLRFIIYMFIFVSLLIQTLFLTGVEWTNHFSWCTDTHDAQRTTHISTAAAFQSFSFWHVPSQLHPSHLWKTNIFLKVSIHLTKQTWTLNVIKSTFNGYNITLSMHCIFNRHVSNFAIVQPSWAVRWHEHSRVINMGIVDISTIHLTRGDATLHTWLMSVSVSFQGMTVRRYDYLLKDKNKFLCVCVCVCDCLPFPHAFKHGLVY